jgi:ketosteroid isomerase-like protein
MNLPMAPSTAAIAPHPHTARVVAFFEVLTAESLARLETVYADDARFIDPFNDVSGLAGVRRVFEHMFETLDAPRFEIVSALTEGEQCFLLWNFRFCRKGSQRISLIHGSTHVRFAADGRIAWHRDYWDPARELYETVPLLGAVMRWLRRRLSAGSSVESR